MHLRSALPQVSVLLILLETLHHSDTHTDRVCAQVQHQRAQLHIQLHSCCGVGGLARGWGIWKRGFGTRLLVSGVGTRPWVRGGLRGPVWLLVTAALCLSLFLVIDCSNTPISAASSMLCENSRMIGRSTFTSKSGEGGSTQASYREQCNSGDHIV